MIGNLTVTLSSKDPTKKCETLRAFVNSPSNVRIVGVPGALGKWKITKVYFVANYPDNQSVSKECTAGVGVYVATIPGSTLPGSSLLGYSVKADGVDENNQPIVGYVLGKGDVEIVDTDGTVTPGVTTHYIHVLPSCPANPKEGDAYVENGTWRFYNGTTWTVLGGVSAGNSYVMAPVANGGDGKWHRLLVVDGTLAYDQEGLDDPPLAADKPWVLTQVSTEATARAAADTANANAITAEATARQQADAAETTARQAAISDEATARAAADTANANAITAEATARTNAVAELAEDLTDEAAARSAADAAETTARQAAISDEATARAAADTANANAITAETTARQAAISDEATARAAADTANANAITAEATARQAAISDEATARAAADTANANAITAEATARTNAVAELADDLTDEAAARSAADAANAAAIVSEAARAAAAEATKVPTDGNATINGTKTFTSSPLVPTIVSTSDNSTKAASTGWVTSKLAAWWNTIKAAAVTFSSTVTASGGFVGDLTGHASLDALDANVLHNTGTETIGGIKTFTSNIINTRDGSNIAFVGQYNGTSRSTNPQTSKTLEHRLCDADGNVVNDIVQNWTNTGIRATHIRSYKEDGSYVDVATFTASADGSTVNAKGSALASVGMPVITGYVDLSLPSSGQFIEFSSGSNLAPWSGYLIVEKKSVNVGEYIYLVLCPESSEAPIYENMAQSVTNGSYVRFSIPVTKRHRVKVNYTLAGDTSMIRFVKCSAEV